MSPEEYDAEIRDLKAELAQADQVIAEYKDMLDTAETRITQLETALEVVKADVIYTIDRVR